MNFRGTTAQMLLVIAGLVGAAGAQNFAPDFGTPQGTARLAASAGFMDILGIKLGMPAENTLAMLKSHYPTARITFEHTQDYEHAWVGYLAREDPTKQFVYQINVDPPAIPGGDRLIVYLTVPPSRQVVAAVSRTTVLKAPVAIENVVEGMRKKYGTESVGINYHVQGMTPFDSPVSKTLVWIYDTQGRKLGQEVMGTQLTNCAATSPGAIGSPDVAVRRSNDDSRSYSLDRLKQIGCSPYVILTASIQTAGPVRGFDGMASLFTLVVYDWPLIGSSHNSFYAFLDQSAQRDAQKAMQDAKQRGGEIKY